MCRHGRSLRPIAILAGLILPAIASGDVVYQGPNAAENSPRTSHDILGPPGSTGLPGDEILVQAFDNFRVSHSTAFAQIIWAGEYVDFNTDINFPSASSFRIFFHADDGQGYPGAQLAEQSFSIASAHQDYVGSESLSVETIFGSQQYDNVPVYVYHAALSTPFVAAANTTYWIRISAFSDNSADAPTQSEPVWLWYTGTGGDSRSVGTNNYFGIPITDEFPEDRAFALIPSSATLARGDFNGDASVSVADISAMMSALADLTNYQSKRGLNTADLLALGDINFDGRFNNADLQALIVLLANGGGSGDGALTAVPEPQSFVLAALTCPVLWTLAARRRQQKSAV